MHKLAKLGTDAASLPASPPGTGSELVMAVDAAKKLEAEGKKVRRRPSSGPHFLLWCMVGGLVGSAFDTPLLAFPRSPCFPLRPPPPPLCSSPGPRGVHALLGAVRGAAAELH